MISLQGGGIIQESLGAIIPLQTGGFTEIGTLVLNDYLYDLNGVLVGHLKGRHVIDANTRSTPIGFRKLLEGKS